MFCRNKLQEKDKLIITKSEVIHQQNKTLSLMKEIMPKTDGNLLTKIDDYRKKKT